MTENTQLTQAIGINTDNIVFSKPIVSSIANSSNMTYKRVLISMKNPDGTTGDLVIPTERLFSFGVNTRNPEGDVKDGYQMSIAMHNRDTPTERELKWIESFNAIVDKCKDYLVDIRDDLGLYDLTKEDSLLKNCNPLKYKKERGKIVPGLSPILGVKLIARKGEIVSLFHDDQGNKIEPLDLFKKYCHVRAALKFESIFIGTKLIAIQVKLYEAQVRLIDNGIKSLLAPCVTAPKPVVVVENTKSSPLLGNDSDYDSDCDIEV